MNDINELEIAEIVDSRHAQSLFNKTRPFTVLMTQYECAMLEIKTKLDVLNAELSLESERNPFESISCRLKTPMSIIEKLKRRQLPVTVDSIRQNIHDVAGVRVICSFPADIYMLAEKLCNQDDIRVLAKKDYIKNPKSNGYRSLHLLLEIPIFLSSEKKFMQVEVQFRTIAMDFWASLEHKVRYKKDLSKNAEHIADELRECAEEISSMDLRMQEIRNRIEALVIRESNPLCP